jgi:hypothetical protein
VVLGDPAILTAQRPTAGTVCGCDGPRGPYPAELPATSWTGTTTRVSSVAYGINDVNVTAVTKFSVYETYEARTATQAHLNS